MSDSKASKSHTAGSETTIDSINLTTEDRWTHIINYQQLVMSVSIGLVQFWRYPYMVPIRGGWPSIIVYLVFYAVLGYPMHYLELAIGTVTRKSVIKCWDILPVGRGIGWAMLIISAHTAFSLSIICAHSLGMLVHSFHFFLPWMHCAADTAVPCSERQAAMKPGSETPAESFFHNELLHMKRNGIENGLGIVIWELSIYYLISWTVIYFIIIKGIYSYSKLVLFEAILAFVTLFVGTVAVLMLEGSFDLFEFGADWDHLKSAEVYRVMAEQVLMELALSQGTVIMLGSHNKQTKNLRNSSFLSVLIAKVVTFCSGFILVGTEGALQFDFLKGSNETERDYVAYSLCGSGASVKCPAVPLVLWADLVARKPGNQFWSSLIFFTWFLLGVSTVAILVHTIMSNVRGVLADRVRWIVQILMCAFFCLVGVVTLCTEGGIYIVGFLDFWAVSMPRLPVAALTAGFITFIYGQKSFCEEVFFTSDEYPSVFLRVCWAISPFVFMMLAIVGGAVHSPLVVYGQKFPPDVTAVGIGLLWITLAPVLVVVLMYLVFRWRIRNIVADQHEGRAELSKRENFDDL